MHILHVWEDQLGDHLIGPVCRLIDLLPAMMGLHRRITEIWRQVTITYIRQQQTDVDNIRHGGCTLLSILWSITCKANLPGQSWKVRLLYKGCSMGKVHQRFDTGGLCKMMRARRSRLRLVDLLWAGCAPEFLQRLGVHILVE